MINNYRQTARIAMIGLVALELILVSSYTFNTERPVITKTEYKQKVFYNDFTKDADTAAINTNYMLDELSADVIALKSESLKLTKFSHNHISGEVTVSKPKALFLSIPFDPSWVAKVDGKAVKIEIGNLGLMALPLSEGKHSIELIFNPPYWNLSWTVSIIGLLLFVGMIVLNTVLIKKWKNNEVQS
jgi:hypothetical protein